MGDSGKGIMLEKGGLSLRLDWEDDDNYVEFDPSTQSATATAIFTVPVDSIMTVDWSGVGETAAPNFELMNLSMDGMLAPAPAGAPDRRRAHTAHRRDDERPALPLRSVLPV